jgi:hypothetical protein
MQTNAFALLVKFNLQCTYSVSQAMELSLRVAVWALGAFILYWIGLVVYRLFFHPLCQFPGSKLAAATPWYEAYHEIVKGGQFHKKISEHHDRYGTLHC